ncbi:CmpA/NrtA family ABC transporter substrate-binding protein [Devosia sp. RR2S18]|uniref:CmpA/NrtA family ABC transporter substrate-binding protein n=1 Tax=Devosia rhizosphaerae TaxID=3049774 RepID=UPI00253F8FDF|nr:CmpA/NrtA family ABC transporter substrate-binding protein [Devosia sp. RR2S18]WIJ24933.1 CmpA/NrtA family ABC transporter substrate-binding protein [Devosia sp. RR2S18]
MHTTHLTAGFLPLLDSVLLVLAHEKGFAAEEGIELHLTRETSWANIRDRAALGHFDIAQMLAPMPIAASLGLTPLATPMVAPVVLGLGNNGITVSAELWLAMEAEGAPADLSAGPTGAALAKVVVTSSRKLRFGVVHQTSSHNYELRYWLAASGVRPDHDVEIVVLPPPLLPEALGSGGIDGYCVGEPWNSVGVATQGARIATVKAAIWQASPDKVIGMRSDWALAHPELVSAVVRAIYRAGLWCDDPANRHETAEIMARPAYLDQPAAIVSRALTGRLDQGGGNIAEIENFFLPHQSAANFPWKSHALWYYSQMVRWGEACESAENATAAAATFRPDLYRAALAPLGANVPAADSKTDGERHTAGDIAGHPGPLTLHSDRFFDGGVFDSNDLSAYIARQRLPPS